MPLHTLTQTGDLAGSAQGLPNVRLPEHVSSAEAAYSFVHDELLLDGNVRQNLATFCTTWSEPEVHRLMDESMDKNMIDKDEYPQTAEIEDRCVHIIADVWHAPHARQTIGCSTTGSSEACMLAGLALKFQWRKRRIAAGASAGTAKFRVQPGPGLLGEVRPVFRRRNPPGPAARQRARTAPR